MPDAPANQQWSPPEEEYELVPYKEISELKSELQKLRDVPIPSSKKMQITMDELALKMDRMVAIFEQASHEMRTEEGGMTFEERMRPIIEKTNKVLEQNSEIAKGIVALADLIEELKGRLEKGFLVKEGVSQPSSMSMGGYQQSSPSPMPSTLPTMPSAAAPQPLPGVMPPPPPRRKLF